jgi:hypothetical protein
MYNVALDDNVEDRFISSSSASGQHFNEFHSLSFSCMHQILQPTTP